MISPYIRLTRLNRPTGIWLLLWPCWWAVAIASDGLPSLKLLMLFGAGAVFMRAAGCIFNDIVDRKIDAQVERTRARPLASGEVSLNEALLLLALLLAASLVIVLKMPSEVLYLAAFSLLLVACYPFMKRITWWPQAFLGLTFNWGALMGWAAVTHTVALPALLLYCGGIAWTLGYDTIYAHQDVEDDLRVGVKSTAIKFGAQSKYWIATFYAFAVFFWCLTGIVADKGALYYVGLAMVGAHFLWQVLYVKLDSPPSCLRVFNSNTVMGWFFFAGLWADALKYTALQL